MSPSESTSNLIKEYSYLLTRDLGFNEWKDWEPMILQVMKILGVKSILGITLSEATPRPGKKIIEALVSEWAKERGKYWGELMEITESSGVTPYYDYKEYCIKIKSPEEFLSRLPGSTVYNNYNILHEIFESQDYQTLRKLNGIKIEIK